MKLLFALSLSAFTIVPLLAQEMTFVEIDSLYREDQLYAGVSYNLLGDKPNDLSQNGFSSGFHFGFIRDIPLNKRRNVAIGIGLGYSGNSYNQNMQIAKDEGKNITYTILSNASDFSKNKFSTHMLEIPIEFRWRTSTLEEYKFWRIYTGFKIGYLFTHKTKYQGQPSNQQYTDIDHFNDFQYGLTTSFGYNTWNIHLYYGLNTLFNDKAFLDGEAINLKSIKIGLMFYLL